MNIDLNNGELSIYTGPDVNTGEMCMIWENEDNLVVYVPKGYELIPAPSPPKEEGAEYFIIKAKKSEGKNEFE